MPLTTLAHRIQKLLALGLLEVTHLEKRSGSPLKHYRAVADAFFVPFEATDAETLETLFERWEKPWSTLFHRSYAKMLNETGKRWGISVWRDETGELRVAPAPQPGQALTTDVPALLDELIFDLRLTDREARALQAELLGIIGRYSGKHGGQGISHFLRVMLTPTRERKVLR